MQSDKKDKIILTLSEIGKNTIGYIKAELIMLAINILIVLIGMIVTGLGWWSPLIAVGVGVFDLLPVVGSGAIFIPWTIIAIVCGNIRMAVCVGVTYIVMVLARMIIEPIITGKHIGLSPLITMISSIVGVLILGPKGIFIGPIVVSIANTIYRLNFKKNDKILEASKENKTSDNDSNNFRK